MPVLGSSAEEMQGNFCYKPSTDTNVGSLWSFLHLSFTSLCSDEVIICWGWSALLDAELQRWFSLVDSGNIFHRSAAAGKSADRFAVGRKITLTIVVRISISAASDNCPVSSSVAGKFIVSVWIYSCPQEEQSQREQDELCEGECTVHLWQAALN